MHLNSTVDLSGIAAYPILILESKLSILKYEFYFLEFFVLILYILKLYLPDFSFVINNILVCIH